MISKNSLPIVWVAVLLATCFVSSVSRAEALWIDVRSLPEHVVDNIEGDLRITHTDIVEEVTERFPDRDREIQLYCRSGGRAGVALQALLDAGYSNVSNAGGIEDARKSRGLVE